MTTPLDTVDFNRLYRQHRELAGRTRKDASAWDSRAAGMAARAGHSPYASAFVAHMDLQGARSLLDVGCGPGTIALRLARGLQRVIGLDYSAAMLAAMRNRAADAHLDNVQTLQLAWEDDWDDVPVCDIVVASRSTNVEDLGQALAKLDAKARLRVYMTHLVGGHFTDPAIQRAVGRHLPPAPDYIYVLNLLHRMDIHPQLSYLSQENRLAGAVDFDDFARRVAWSMSGLDEEETARLRHWYERSDPRQRQGAPMRWALISWEKAAA